MKQDILYHQMLVSPHIGGAAKLAMEIHKFSVAHRGPVSRLLIPGGGDAERVAIEENFPFVYYNLNWLVSRNRFKAAVGNLWLLCRMARFVPAILHFHSPFVYGAARPFLRAAQPRTVLHIHLDYSPDQLRWPLKLLPDLILVSARSVLPIVEEALLGVREERMPKVRVLQNAVDTDRFFPSDRLVAKQQLSLDPNVPVALMIANLAPHKGQETALRSVALLRRRGCPVRLRLVGEERGREQSYLSHLRALTRQLAIEDRVDFLGFRSDVPDLLRAADFLLLPSTSETLSLVVLESQATKVVVLAAPTADLPLVIENGKTGYLIAADDVEGYADRIAALIANRPHMEAISESAYTQVRASFQLQHYCRTVLEEYDGLLQR